MKNTHIFTLNNIINIHINYYIFIFNILINNQGRRWGYSNPDRFRLDTGIFLYFSRSTFRTSRFPESRPKRGGVRIG